MIKITWLDINASFSHSSAALPLIEAQNAVERKPIEWSVVKGTPKNDIRDIVEQVCSLQSDIVCFTSWLFTYDYLYSVLARVKALRPEVIIFGGGPEYLGDNEDFLRRHPFIDFVFRGEGEQGFYRFLDALHLKDKSSVAGLCFLEDGIYRDYGLNRVRDFACLQLPEDSQFFDFEKPFVQIETTRGCFNGCTFCVSGNDKPLREQSLDLVAARIKRVDEAGIRDVRILDRTFNSNPRRAIGILEIMEQYPQMNFHLELHPALLTENVKSKIASLPKGLLHIEAGIQSLDDEVLRLCGRAGERDKAIEGLKFLCSLENIETHADLIAGLPSYTLAQVYRDVVSLSQIKAGEIQLESLKVLPGTQMRALSQDLGLKYSPLPPYEILASEQISAAELRESMVLSRILDFYYNKPAWRSLFSLCVEEYGVDFLRSLSGFYIAKDCYNQPLSAETSARLLFEFLQIESSQYKPEVLCAFRVRWIENGLSLRKAPIDNLSSSSSHPEGETLIEYGIWSEEQRLYHFEELGERHIFGFDRSQKHSAPVYYAKQKLCRN